MKQILSRLAPTILFIHGNHEQRPWDITGYEQTVWSGGKVWYPNLIFAVDGEIYDIFGIRYLVIGGAYSVNKSYRLDRRYGWWADQQPSAEIKPSWKSKSNRTRWMLSCLIPAHFVTNRPRSSCR